MAQLKPFLFAAMMSLGGNIHAASESIPMEFLELLGEVDDTDALNQMMDETERTRKETMTQTKPEAPKTQPAGGK